MKARHITSLSLFQYGLLAAPIAFAGFPLYVLAPDFYATEYGIPLGILGIALLAIRLFDAFQDPLIGFYSDRYRRHSMVFIIFSAAVLCLSIYSLFIIKHSFPLLGFILYMALAVTAYSVISINLNSLGALWTKNTIQQTRIVAIRESLGLIGLIIAVSLPNLLIKTLPEEQVYYWFSLSLAVLMIIAVFSFYGWWRQQENIKIDNLLTKYSLFTGLKNLSGDAKKLLLVYMVSMLASSIPAVLVIFFVRDLLNANDYTGIFLLFYFLAGALFMPVWKIISVRYGKYRSWGFSMILAVVSFIWAFTLSSGDTWQYLIICIASGSALGADLVFPPSILADQIHKHQAEQQASMHYSLLTLIAKISLALASATSLPLLQIVGFSPNTQNSIPALMGLSIAYALIPCLLKCGAIIMLWRMFINYKKGDLHENNQINSNPRSNDYA